LELTALMQRGVQDRIVTDHHLFFLSRAAAIQLSVKQKYGYCT
jgi:hypothetical protein